MCEEFVTAGWALCTWLHGPSESQADIDVYVDGRKNDIHVDMRRLAITAEHSWLRGIKVRIVVDFAGSHRNATLPRWAELCRLVGTM